MSYRDECASDHGHITRPEQLAELALESWSWCLGTASSPDGEVWRHTDGTLRPLAELLNGEHRTT